MIRLHPTPRSWLLTAPLVVAASISLGSMPAHGQQVPPRMSDGVATPAKGLASTDDASAVYLNPANLAFLPGAEARFTMVHTGDDSPVPNRGYALDLAVPFWVLASGLRIDWMNPTPSSPPPYAHFGQGHHYDWVRWGNAVRLGEFAALGVTMAWAHADEPHLDGHFSATTGLTVRPNRFFTAAVVARDWNTPVNERGDTTIEPSVDMGIAFRPIMGRPLLEIGGEGSYRSGVDRWVPGANVAVAIPNLGRLRVGGQLLDPSDTQMVATAALDINFDHLQVTGGAVFGNAIRRDGTGMVFGAALRSFVDTPQVPMTARVLRLRFESTPNVRQHVRLLRTLWRLADDDQVAGVLLELRAKPADSLAHAEELVDALRLLKTQGKKVLCHLEDAGARALYVCSEADRVAINPAGGIRFAGLSTRYLFFGGLLKKLGVRADFVRIGAHKLAPEQLNEGPSEIGRADRRALLKAVETVYLDQVSRGRALGVETARRNIAKGPFIAPEARDAGLVDALVYEDEIERFVEEAIGHRVRVVDLDLPTVAPKYWRAPPKIALIYLHGNMVDGQSQKIPLIGLKLAGSYTIAKALKTAREDPTVKAVVFRIETGGGSSLAADVILREAMLTAKAKPLVVSMGTMAASGGYYAAVAGNEILANRSTLTGSIGIFYGKVDVVGLLDKLGVKTQSLRTAPRADAESLFRPFTDQEHVELAKKVKQFYDLFVGRVAAGRKLSVAEVHAVAQGHVWTGDQAKKRGLVDRIGGLRQALERARELADLSADTPIIELPKEESTLLDVVLTAAGVPSLKGDEAIAWVPPPLMAVARALVPFVLYEPYKPLARVEVMVDQP